jgi:thiol-disulfide isomerase/thioredoxin
MTDPTRPSSSSGKKRLALIVAGGIAGLAVGLAGVYGVSALRGNAGGDPACRPAVALAKKVAPFARGEVAAVSVATSPLKIPDLTFEDAAGKKLSLADFRGRTVLLNLWATWCVPCRREMPTLDALEGQLGGPRFQVVAVNIDTRDPDKPKKFLQQIGVKKLTYYADPSAKAFQDLKAIGRAFGMPTTLLVDPHGCEIGSIAGPAEWASKDAVKLIEAALGGEKQSAR